MREYEPYEHEESSATDSGSNAFPASVLEDNALRAKSQRTFNYSKNKVRGEYTGANLCCTENDCVPKSRTNQA